MNLYREHVLPWLIDLSMRQSRLAPYRCRAAPFTGRHSCSEQKRIGGNQRDRFEILHHVIRQRVDGTIQDERRRMRQALPLSNRKMSPQTHRNSSRVVSDLLIHFDTHAYASSSRIGGPALMGAGKRHHANPARTRPAAMCNPMTTCRRGRSYFRHLSSERRRLSGQTGQGGLAYENNDDCTRRDLDGGRGVSRRL
jgi:hypothetical protein